MPPTSTRHRWESFARSWPALRLLAAALLMMLVIETVPSAEAWAQTVAKPKGNPPVPTDARPMARYAAKDKLLLLIESNGLNAQPDAWKKTAAYRMLNDTTLGEMLEGMLTQLADRLLQFSPVQKLSGADVSQLVKHVAKQGFVVAVVGDDKGATYTTIVLRGGYSARESRPAFSRLMGTMMGTGKFASMKKGVRTVVQVTPETGKPWIWWPEQGDLVITGNVDAALATIDGKSPNAADHPLRAALAKTDAGFSPLGLMFLDPAAVSEAKPDFMVKIEKALSDMGVTRADYRWGFHDEALMSVARLQAPKPRKGVLAVVDEPPFDRTKLPPLPDSIESFSVFTVDANKALDAILPAIPALPPQAGAVADEIAALELKSRVDFRKDILGRIGPKMAAYLMPGSTPSRTAETTAKADPNPLSEMLGIALPAMGSVAFPRLTLLAEVKDPDGLGLDIDQLMVALNKELKAKAAEAEKARDAAEKTARPGGLGGRAGLGDAGRPGGRRQDGPVPAPEFQLMPGKERAYVLTLPSDEVKHFPAGFRPTIRLGGKYLAIAANPEAARLALEAKQEGYTPGAELAVSLDRLPKELSYLMVSDPRSSAPELLSTLPATIQGLVNAILTATQPATADEANANAAANAAARNRNAPAGGSQGAFAAAGDAREEKRGGGGRGPGPGGGGPPPGAPGGFGASGPAGAMPGMKGMLGANPGGPQATRKPDSAKASSFFFDIEASLLPSADDLKSKLFPTVLAVSADDREVVIQSRGAFYNPVSKETVAALSFLIPLGKAMRDGGTPPGSIAAPGGFPNRPGGPPAAGPPGRGGRGAADGGGGARNSDQ